MEEEEVRVSSVEDELVEIVLEVVEGRTLHQLLRQTHGVDLVDTLALLLPETKGDMGCTYC